MKSRYIPLVFATLLAAGCASQGGSGGSSSSGAGGVLSSIGGAVSQIGGTTSGGTDVGLAAGAATDLAKAATVSDKDIQAASLQSIKYMDKANNATTSGKYGARVRKLTSKLTNADGLKLNFKAVLVREPNAFATPDGSIRITAGLMELMNDDELRCVIGHEIGHVKLGHSASEVRAALITSAARKGIAATNTVAGAVAAGDIGAFSEKLIGAQYSQSAETEADDYGMALVKRYKFKPMGCVTAMEKLAKLDSSSSMMSSHPASANRAQRMRDQLNK